MTNLFSGPAIRVSQPIGSFWVAAVPAAVLLECTVPDPLRIVLDPAFKDTPEFARHVKTLGNQRKLQRERLAAISDYIDSIESTFPNSIILAAPGASSELHSSDVKSSERGAWKLSSKEAGVANLEIPTSPKLASVVDGQHRLYAFLHTQIEQRKNFELLCSIFFDIPMPVQAMVFATINTTQKPVPRAMALNLFGYNVEDEERDLWSPEKLCVFIARRLNFDKDGSRLFHRIKIEAEGAPTPVLLNNATRAVSLTAIVDGVRGLISVDPKQDHTTLRSERVFRRPRRKDLKSDRSPLRAWYLDCADRELYDLVRGFVAVIDTMFWHDAPARSMLTRAVGIRALFAFLRAVLTAHGNVASRRSNSEIEILVRGVGTKLEAVSSIDFADSYFEATGRGQSRILHALLVGTGEQSLDSLDLPDADRIELRRIVGGR